MATWYACRKAMALGVLCLFLAACGSLPTLTVAPTATAEPTCHIQPQPTGEKLIPMVAGTPPPPQAYPGQTIYMSVSGGYFVMNNAVVCGDKGIIATVYSNELPGWQSERTITLELDGRPIAELRCDYECAITATIPYTTGVGIYPLEVRAHVPGRPLAFELLIVPSTTPTTSPTSVSMTATPTASPTPIPTIATPTLRVTATPRPVPTATPSPVATPLVRVEGAATDGTCVSVDETIRITAQVFGRPDFEQAIEAYLNAGGSIGGLLVAASATSPERAIRMQVVGEDVTDDEIPDLLIGVTLPYAQDDGETHLLFLPCVDGQYEAQVLFRRAGAGSRMKGLYAGGGAAVEHVGDLNGNGKADVLLSVNWPGYAEVYLLEWDGNQFVSLIAYRNLLGATCTWIETSGEAIEVVDLEGDGAYEIAVGEGEARAIWRWDGERYRSGED